MLNKRKLVILDVRLKKAQEILKIRGFLKILVSKMNPKFCNLFSIKEIIEFEYNLFILKRKIVLIGSLSITSSSKFKEFGS